MFFSVFGSNASRQSLLHALQNAFQDLSQIVELQCCLVGGSFVDLFNPAPNDIDIVAFYRVPDGAPFEPDGLFIGYRENSCWRGSTCALCLAMPSPGSW